MSKELAHLWRTAKSLELTQEEKIACAQNIGISVREKQSVRQRVHMTEKRLFTLAKELSLSPREKVDAREWIFHRSSHSFSFSSLFRFSSFTSAIASLLIVSIASGGIASAAESAMPDDVLYPIKIHINEPIMASMQSTEADRLLFTSMQVERRSDELEHLFSVETDNIALVDTVTSLLHQHSSSLSSKIDEIDDVLAKNIEEKTRRIEENLHKKQKKMVAMKMKNPLLQEKISSLQVILLDARMNLREPSLLNEEEAPTSADLPMVATFKTDDAPLAATVMSAPVVDPEEIAFLAKTRVRALRRMQKKMVPVGSELPREARNARPLPPPLPVLMLEESEKEMNAGNMFQANEISKKAMKEMRKMRREGR
jgi:hypothetical protein